MDLKTVEDHNPNLFMHLTYEGVVTCENVEGILDLIKTNMPQWLPNSSASKASRLAVECLQNIIRHAHNCMAYVVIYHQDKSINLLCRNFISEADKQRLETVYKMLEEHDPQEYQQLYREQLKKASINERGGAGIGLFDIAYRMGKPPIYKIEPTGKDNLYFYTVTIELTETI